MTIKPIRWVGPAREEIQSLPEEARKEAGFSLWTLQQGIQPPDFKPMSIVGKGVEEIRIRTENAYRVFYIARFNWFPGCSLGTEIQRLCLASGQKHEAEPQGMRSQALAWERAKPEQ
ncbi:type II toxin-antitoxin system RelE/ParE family toxin [Microcoleus sp.]|uniref:type II toxin-antitoxin system RelE/ParE family toxin n=1 Tax=Microcoleus sp. TaxID=44472 RepID=UPI003523645C